jgi:anti-anti-sigma factor
LGGGASDGQTNGKGLRWPLRVTTERCNGVLVVAAAGRISHATAGTLTAVVEMAIGREQHGLVIDLGGVDYLSSAGLMALDRAATLLAEGHSLLVLCVVREPVRIALDLAGLTPRFAIEPSRVLAASRVIRNDLGRNDLGRT